MPLPDLWSMWWGLHDGKMSAPAASAQLKPLLASEIALYQQRVAELVTTMNEVAAELNAAAVCWRAGCCRWAGLRAREARDLHAVEL